MTKEEQIERIKMNNGYCVNNDCQICIFLTEKPNNHCLIHKYEDQKQDPDYAKCRLMIVSGTHPNFSTVDEFIFTMLL